MQHFASTVNSLKTCWCSPIIIISCSSPAWKQQMNVLVFLNLCDRMCLSFVMLQRWKKGSLWDLFNMKVKGHILIKITPRFLSVMLETRIKPSSCITENWLWCCLGPSTPITLVLSEFSSRKLQVIQVLMSLRHIWNLANWFGLMAIICIAVSTWTYTVKWSYSYSSIRLFNWTTVLVPVYKCWGRIDLLSDFAMVCCNLPCSCYLTKKDLSCHPEKCQLRLILP